MTGASVRPVPTALRTRAVRAGVVLGAVAVAFVVWAVGVLLAGGDPVVSQGSALRPVGPVAAAVTAGLAGLAGWGLLTALERFVPRRARLTWTIIAAVVLALSMTGPLGSGVDVASTVTLAGMHLAVGATLILGLARSARVRS